MSRQYVIGSWSNADEYDYSGEQAGNRFSASREVSHFTKNGKANVSKYADVKPTKRKPASIFDRICPQQKRLSVLESQLKELDKERFKVDEETFHEYRCVLLKKIARQRILVDKAMNWEEPSLKHQSKPVVCREKQAEKTFEEERYAKVLPTHKGANFLKKLHENSLTCFVLWSSIAFVAANIIFR